jgi:lysophospholipase L1-like esterase
MRIQSIVQPITRPVVRSVVDRLRVGSGAPPAPPAPTTVSYTSAQLIQGFTGPTNTTDPTKTYVRQGRTVWVGFITGSEAKLTATSDYGDIDGAVLVAINGGAFAAAPRVGQQYTLFSGAHAKRFVEFRVMEAAGDAGFIPASANALQVTGQPPSLQTMGRVQVGSDSALGLYAGATIANENAQFLPLLQAPKGEDWGSNIGSAKLRGAFTNLAVTVHALRRVGVSKNGGPPSFYTATAESGETGAPARAILISCDGSVSTYNVWDDGCVRNEGGTFAVSGDSTLLDIGVRRRMDQYGDSQSFGAGPGAIPSDVETMQVAAALGFVGTTVAISGLTIEALKPVLDRVLPRKTVGSTDVAILAIGANNAGAGITSTDQANYLDNINKLLAKGYGKILCRAILPPNEDPSMADPANALLKSVVTTLANPKVVWIDTRSWTPWGTIDGAHPTAAGYTTLAGFATPAYSSVLGL